MQDCIHKALCPGLGFLHGMSTSSDTPSHTVLLLSSTATEFALCLLDSEKWQNWEMSCPPPKANLIVWQQMICNYLWEVLHFMPIASLTQILPKGRILDLIWHYTFLKKIMFSRREISLLISPFLSSPLLCSSLSTEENSWYPFQTSFRKQEVWIHLFLSPREPP